MPRPKPKRSRATATRPPPAQNPRESSESPAPISKPVPSQPAPVTTATTANDFSSDIYDVSDREKERMRARAAATASATQATANANTHDHAPSRSTRTSTRARRGGRHELDEKLADMERTRVEAMERLDQITSTTSASAVVSGAIRSPAQENLSSDSLRSTPPEIGRSTVHDMRRPRATDVSGLDLDDDVFGDLDDSLGDDGLELEDEQTAQQQQEGQRSHDSTGTSSFNVALFKRRPRQSSIVGRDDAPIRPSSRAGATPSISRTLNMGRFRRRQREPSILGTAQKGRASSRASQASGDERGYDTGFETDASAAEGRATRGGSRARGVDSSREPSPTRQSRKRKSLESHDGRGKRRSAATEEGIRQSIEVDHDRQSDAPDDDSLPVLGTPEQRPQTPDVNDPALGPPMSSGSVEGGSPFAYPPLESLAHKTYRKRPESRAKKTPELDDLASNISSPPSLTHSPNYAPAKRVAKAKKARKPSPKTTTAALASLLPRRRHQEKDNDSDDESSLDEDDDEDEISRFNPRSSRTRRPAAPLAATSANSKGAVQQKLSAAAAGKKKARRTYGSNQHEKENDAEDEENVELGTPEAEEEEGQLHSEMSQEQRDDELKKAAAKFREVDKWELAFEEVTGSSSPPGAR